VAFRLALVGAGRMGTAHARALASSRAVEIACVVEQDVLPDPEGTAAADQRANREYLAARGF